MPTINLNNITIKKLPDKNFNNYYLIVNNDNQNEAYFCFEGAVKDGWNNLVNNWENIKEVELEFEINDKGNKKVISIFTPQGNDFIV